MKKKKNSQLKINTNSDLFDLRSLKQFKSNLSNQKEQLMNNQNSNVKKSTCITSPSKNCIQPACASSFSTESGNQIIKNKSFFLGEKIISTVTTHLKNHTVLSSSNLNSINQNFYSVNPNSEKHEVAITNEMKNVTGISHQIGTLDGGKNITKVRVLSPMTSGERSIAGKLVGGEHGYMLNGNNYVKHNGGSLSTKMTKKSSMGIFNKNNNVRDNPNGHSSSSSNSEVNGNEGKFPSIGSKAKISIPSKVSIHKSFEANKQTTNEASSQATSSSQENINSSNENISKSVMANSPLNVMSHNNNIIPVTNEGPELISVCSLINNQNIPLCLSNLSAYFPQYESTKCSTKPIGNIRAYGANTYQGIIRNYNEDRVSIILNIAKPPTFKGTWPKCSIFGIYDGHGGCNCADFLRDQLHTYIIKDTNFPQNPKEALIKGFEHAENDYLVSYAMTKDSELMDKSGSCAVVALFVDDMCYVANVGDSRAVLSSNGGRNVQVLTIDHKPNEEAENKRIIDNGGKVYQTQTPTRIFNFPNLANNGTNQILVGPSRVFPGRLSVSRTFGDVEAKIPKFGGLPGVVIATPEISMFNIINETDFLVMGCDGIFDQLSNSEIVECVWMTMKNETKEKTVHSQCALAIDMIIKSSLVRKTLDNVTVLLIAFENFENLFNESTCVKRDNFSPKSSFYLCNVIENKETDSCSPHYMNTEPNPENTLSQEVLVKADVARKSLSPKSKDVCRGVSTKSDIMNNLNCNRNDNQNTSIQGKVNKVVSFEIAKKIVLSPKSKKVLQNGAIHQGNGK